MVKPSKKQDAEHLRNAYAQLVDTIDELSQVYRKDNTLAHTYRVLRAIEDTMYQYITDMRRMG